MAGAARSFGVEFGTGRDEESAKKKKKKATTNRLLGK
jgi:hypothetical protein